MALRTIVEDGIFRNQYVKCNCCNLNLHVYFYPLNRKTNVRTIVTCISCQRDCTKTKCNLGVLHEH